MSKSRLRALPVVAAALVFGPSAAASPSAVPTLSEASPLQHAGEVRVAIGGGTARGGGPRQEMWWLLMGSSALALTLALVGLWRHRTAAASALKKAQRQREKELKSLKKQLEHRAELEAPEPLRRRVCLRCGKQYPLDVRFCGRDGTELVLSPSHH